MDRERRSDERYRDGLSPVDLLRNWWGVSSVAFLLQAVFSAWCCNNALAVQGKAFWSKSSNKAIINATLFGILRSIDGALRFATGDDSGTSVVIAIFHAGAGFLFWGVLGAQVSFVVVILLILCTISNPHHPRLSVLRAIPRRGDRPGQDGQG